MYIRFLASNESRNIDCMDNLSTPRCFGHRSCKHKGIMAAGIIAYNSLILYKINEPLELHPPTTFNQNKVIFKFRILQPVSK
jgi:hypothetical protein